MSFTRKLRSFLTAVSVAALAIIANAASVDAAEVESFQSARDLGTIRGVVRDNGGSPIADATVAIFRLGTSKLLKQVKSTTDGSFLAKIMPGTYTVLAVAQGFNPVTLSDVQVNRTTDVVYGFRLERAGAGNTLPEKRLDRNSSKWRIRASQSQRSIYQNREGNAPVDEDATADSDTDASADDRSNRPGGQSVVESYFGQSRKGAFGGVNFATLVPINADAEIIVAGQIGTGKVSPLRIETEFKFRPNPDHQVRVSGSYTDLGSFVSTGSGKHLGQASFQTLDEWKVREGVIFVFGLDYSRFVGAGDDFSISPRFGLQFDVNPKTRVRTAFTTQTEDRTWARAVDLEGASVIFRDPVSVDDLVIENGKPRMNRSNRLEFGIERVLDNRSTLEANAFVDTTFGRGVGLNSVAFDTLGNQSFAGIVADQQGRSQGVRLVYNRRLSGVWSTAVGYSIGQGQQLSSVGISDPSEIFQNAVFQSFFGQVAADLKTGTSLKTVYRLSSQATVFAIDPFKGQLAIYDPGLSVMVTQNLPNLGLPFRAEAIVDARNLFDLQNTISSDMGSLRINSQRRMLRGGILVRF
ncbi:MAG TPA: carboxypeptidase-like regulatory domain-containing protein [Pyrinomonadaceae bacterium]|nr:carboxypeptidase regulatory-like domain-containing protein [Chloracidobacterium sp.]MBP9934320.1 carboxypeptidase regulatory-like domain-containing protein [Pyrinomonadaceae bacterium]MBK9436802.1 carboxypeptidase regulatory-like domain-containing protein [Chloracidobacterium sp.]MBK9766452.1 carboxypeptidase regulatory-like domain-containing protein [Chloracidobacterium sp.]HQX56361.1 carboxypeptidase-like regulatory domain-containing protein [Pyrinomonadaceae bacterium]